MKGRIGLLSIVTVFFLTGCSMIDQVYKETTQEVTGPNVMKTGDRIWMDEELFLTAEEKAGLLGDEARLIEIKEELINLEEFKGQEVTLYSTIQFYNTHINLVVQNPSQPGELDWYRYGDNDGKYKWVKAGPDKHNADIYFEGVSLEAVPFENAARFYDYLVNTALELDEAEAKPSVTLFTPMESREAYWQGGIESTRADYNYVADLNLNEIKRDD